MADDKRVPNVEVVNDPSSPVPVVIGTVGAEHNRNINAASSTFPASDGVAQTNTATWTASEAITEVSVTPIVTTTQDANSKGNKACLVIFNQPTRAAAEAALANLGSVDTASIGSPVSYSFVAAGETITRSFNAANPCLRVDVLPIGTGNTVMRVGITALGA